MCITKHPLTVSGEGAQHLVKHYRSTWDAPPDFAALHRSTQQETLWLPFFGWQDGRWHDGPVVHASTHGELLHYIPVGCVAKLNFTVTKQTSKEHDPTGIQVPAALIHDQFSSLVWATKSFVQDNMAQQETTWVHVQDYSAEEALWCALLSAAFADQPVLLQNPPAHVPLGPQWRRFWQHLGWEPSPAAPPKHVTPLTAQDFLPVLQETRHIPLLVWLKFLNQRSQMIPATLIQALTAAENTNNTARRVQ